ncbi:MAG: DUF1080 domain-containing protein [Pirellulales bacterium]|nr:DUF1080 domain-containing protein [Pirellulales bacterium]
MKTHAAERIALLFALIVVLPGSETSAADVTPPEGFVALFNGRDLTGWKGLEHMDPAKYKALSKEERQKLDAKNAAEFAAHWSVRDGELVNDGKGPYATTVRDYTDFELRLEFKLAPKADSGVYLRGTPQVQLWDTTEEGGSWKYGAKKGSGGLYNNKKNPSQPTVHADKPLGEWNTLIIKLVDRKVTVTLNGKRVVDGVTMENYWNRKKPLYPTGPIQLQTHGGETCWRNIFLREIERKGK